jgi:MFS family permease
MSTTLTITGIASVVGALAFGPLFDRFNGLLVLTVAQLLEGLTIGLAPWCPHLIGYQIMVALTSVCNFGILAGQRSSAVRGKTVVCGVNFMLYRPVESYSHLCAVAAVSHVITLPVYRPIHFRSFRKLYSELD